MFSDPIMDGSAFLSVLWRQLFVELEYAFCYSSFLHPDFTLATFMYKKSNRTIE